MKKIISLILVGLIGLSIIPKTLVNEKHIVLESTTSVYTKEEVDSLLSAIRNNIANNTNELTNIKSELTTLQNSLKNYALKTSLNTTNSNIDGLNTVASSNASKISALETLYSGGNATAAQILKGKTAIVGGKQITGTMTNKSGTHIWVNGDNGTFYDDISYTWSNGTVTNEMVGFKSNSSGYFDSSTKFIFGTKSSLAPKIKAGEKMLGITGTYTSDANATASQILSGQTAYVNGSKITGTMENKGSLDWKPTTSTTYTVPAGYYSGGTLDSSSVYQAGYDKGLAETPVGSRYGIIRVTGNKACTGVTATVPSGAKVVARGIETAPSGFGCASLSTSATISGTTLTCSVCGSTLTGGFQNWTMVVVYTY